MTHTSRRRAWSGLAVLCLPVLLISMDVSVLFFAVPDIARDLAPSATQMLWVLDVYGFVLAGLLLTMGAVADRFGRRRVLLLGALAFGAASVLAAFSPSAEWLVATRALLGVGGATLMPSTLAIVRDLFPDPAERARAVGTWSAVMAGGVGLGPVVAGLLLDHFWWGSVFLVNLPVLAVLLVAGPLLLPESRDASARIDLLGSVLSLTAVLGVVHALKDVATHGWSTGAVLAGGVGLAAAAAFLAHQRRSAHPMVDLALFRRRGLGGAVVVQVVAMFGVMGNAVVLTQYLQSVLGLSALVAALWSLAPSVVVGGAAPLSAVLAQRVGRPPVMAGGFLLAAGGFAAMRSLDVGSPVWVAVLVATPVAAGLVSVATLVTEYAVGVAPAGRTGRVSALTETAAELGGALGMAVLGSVVAAVYGSRVAVLLPRGLAPEAARTAGEGLGAASSLAARLGGAAGRAVLDAGRLAYVDAMHAAALVAAGLLVAGAATAWFALPRRAEEPAPAEAVAEEEAEVSRR